jgi:hypothetical protein
MASRSVTVVLKNSTYEASLQYLASSLSWVAWDVEPPLPLIGPGQLVAWTSDSDGVATGTQGSPQLYLEAGPESSLDIGLSDPSKRVTINWDNPYAGSNAYSGNAPAAYALTHQGG